MRKAFVLTIVWVSLTHISIGQSVNNKSLLAEKRKKLQDVQAAFSGKPEMIDILIKTGAEGLALTKAGDYENLFFFNQAISIGYYYKQQFDSTSHFLEKAYAAAEKGQLIELSTKPLGNLVSVYHYMGLQDKADTAAKKLKALSESTDTLKSKADIYYNLGLYNLQQKSYYSIGLDYFLKSAAQRKLSVDTSSFPKLKIDYAATLSMATEVYLKLKQPEKALEYLKKAEPYLGSSVIIKISVYGKFIRGYVMLNDEVNAKKYYDLLHQTIAESPGNWSEAVSSSIEMSELAIKKKDYTTAKYYVDKALAQAEKDKKEVLVSSAQLAYGNYYAAIGDYANAIKFYKLIIPASEKYSKEQQVSYLKSITEASIKTGDLTGAITNFTHYNAVLDSMTTQKISLNIAEMEAIYQNKEKQQEIQLQKTEINYARKQRFWLIGGLLLAGLTALLLLIIYRNKQRTAAILDTKNKELGKLNTALHEANKTKAKLFSIISHDLRSPISQVYQFLKLQQLNPDALNSEQKNELSNKIQTATGSLLETMEDLLLWSKTQMNEFKTSIQPTNILPIVEACESLFQLNLEAKNIHIKKSIDENNKVYTDPYFLQTILRNILQNAVKAAPQNSHIEIATTQADKNIVLQIKNEGRSFSQQDYEQVLASEENTSSLNGLGLRLINDLSKKIGAVVQFDNSQENSTVVSITFPV